LNYKHKLAENRKLLKLPKALSSLMLSSYCVWICFLSLILPLQSQTNFACGWAKWLKEMGFSDHIPPKCRLAMC